MALAKKHMNLIFKSAATPVTHLFLARSANSWVVTGVQKHHGRLDPKELWKDPATTRRWDPKNGYYIYIYKWRVKDWNSVETELKMLDHVRHTVNLYHSVAFPMESPSISRRIERFPAKKNKQRDLVKRDCKQQARHRKRSLGYVQTMDWIKGKLQESPIFNGQIYIWFPVKFPLNQSIDSDSNNVQT